jgi:SAM-dependent methyltransferase
MKPFLLSEPWYPHSSSRKLIETVATKPQGAGPVWDDYLFDHSRRFASDIDYVTRFVPAGARILEVGARHYFLTRALLARSYEMTVLDAYPASDAERTLMPGAEYLQCDLDTDTISANDGAFDAVICNEVFEHLRIDLIHSLSELLRVLKPGGRLLLSTPNLRSVTGLYNLLIRGEAYSCIGDVYENFRYVRNGPGNMGHIREYTSKEVTTFLSKIGFEVEGLIFRSRGCYTRSQRLYHLLTAVCPTLRPFFSVVARKPAS